LCQNDKIMARTTSKFELQSSDKTFLENFLKGGTAKAREIKRAQALLKFDKGLSVKEIKAALEVSENMLFILRRTYRKEGLNASLFDKPRSGRPRGLTGCDRAKVTLLACSDAPAGHAEWTLRLLADKAVELNLIEKGSLSHTEVQNILKKTNLDLT